MNVPSLNSNSEFGIKSVLLSSMFGLYIYISRASADMTKGGGSLRLPD